MNDGRMGFATILAESGPRGFLGMNECEKYGMAYGCNEDCPVYQRGECKNEDTLVQLGAPKKTRTMKYDNTPENCQAWRNRARERANRYWRNAYNDKEVREIVEESFYEACRWLSEKIREELKEKGI